MQKIFIPQYELTLSQKSEISNLLSICFEGFPAGRYYYRQLPHLYWFLIPDLSSDMRVSAHANENSDIINKSPSIFGMIAGIIRNIRINDQIIQILGIMDVCVHPNYRNKELASILLLEVENFAKSHDIPLMILFADNPALYLKNGFETRQAFVRWQMIDEIAQKSENIDEKRMDDCFMLKKLRSNLRISEMLLNIDLLGWIF